MKTLKLILAMLFAAIGCEAQLTTQLSNVWVKGTMDLRTNGNLTNANIVTAAHFVGDGSGLTGVAGAGGGLTALGGKGTNNVLAAPVLTNAMIVASNTSTTSWSDSNAVPGTNLYRLHLGGTNQNMDRFFAAGVELFDTGVWDATNNVWAVRDIQTGRNIISASNQNETVAVPGNLVIGSNIYLPNPVSIFSSGTQILFTQGANIFLGVNAGNALPGTDDVGIGVNALFNTSSDIQNVAVGYESGYSLSSGFANTMVGATSLASETGGKGNTALGAGTMSGLLTGNTNIAIGFKAGTGFTGSESYNIDIGSIGISGESGIIRLGTPGTQTDAYVAGALHLTNVIQLTGPTVDSTNVVGPRGQTNIVGGTNVWTRDGSGNLLMAGWLTLSNMLTGTNRLNFSLGGWTNWALAAKTNTFAVVDTNGNDAVTVTNVTHSIGFHGNANFDSNVTMAGIVSGAGVAALSNAIVAQAVASSTNATNFTIVLTSPLSAGLRAGLLAQTNPGAGTPPGVGIYPIIYSGFGNTNTNFMVTVTNFLSQSFAGYAYDPVNNRNITVGANNAVVVYANDSTWSNAVGPFTLVSSNALPTTTGSTAGATYYAGSLYTMGNNGICNSGYGAGLYSLQSILHSYSIVTYASNAPDVQLVLPNGATNLPLQVTFDGSGNLYAIYANQFYTNGNTPTNCISKFTTNGIWITNLGLNAILFDAQGIAFNTNDDNLYALANSGGGSSQFWSIYQVRTNDGRVTELQRWTGSPSSSYAPIDLSFPFASSPWLAAVGYYYDSGTPAPFIGYFDLSGTNAALMTDAIGQTHVQAVSFDLGAAKTGIINGNAGGDMLFTVGSGRNYYFGNSSSAFELAITASEPGGTTIFDSYGIIHFGSTALNGITTIGFAGGTNSGLLTNKVSATGWDGANGIFTGTGYASTATNRGAIAATGWTNGTGVNCLVYITSGTAINVTNIDGLGNSYMTNLAITITSPYTIAVQPNGAVQTAAAAGFYHAQ